jgi:hypothetical protein
VTERRQRSQEGERTKEAPDCASLSFFSPFLPARIRRIHALCARPAVCTAFSAPAASMPTSRMLGPALPHIRIHPPSRLPPALTAHARVMTSRHSPAYYAQRLHLEESGSLLAQSS